MFSNLPLDLVDTKTIQRSYGESHSTNIDQSIWQKFLIDLNLKLSCYHETKDIILFASPYSLEEICQIVNESLDLFNLTCITPIIVDYLFSIGKDSIEKLDSMLSINIHIFKQLMNQMSIIVIDTKSTEMITIPSYSSNLSATNANINDHTPFQSHYIVADQQLSTVTTWKMRWSTNAFNTSVNFQKIMNVICDSLIKDENMMKEFVIYVDKPPNDLPENISELKKRISTMKKKEQDLENRIQNICAEARTKLRNKNRKGALSDVKRKRQLEKELAPIQIMREIFENQIRPIDLTLYDLSWNLLMDEDELESELAELTAMMS